MHSAPFMAGLLGRAALLAFVSFMLKAPLSAALISHDGFDYPPNTPISTRNGGSGWTLAWTGANNVTTIGLNFPSLAITGTSLRTAGDNISSVRPFTTAGFAGLRVNGRFGAEGTELWLSFLVRRDTNFPSGAYGGLSLMDNDTEEIFIGIPTGATHWSVQQFDLGAAPANITVAASAPIVPGATTLLVLRLQFGVNGTQDRVDLYVNPSPGVLPTNADATRTGADIFFDRIRIQSGLSGAPSPVSFDEFRLGESYADVTPTVAGPAVRWLRAGSQRLTAGAEMTLPLSYALADGDPTSLALAVTASDLSALPPDRIVIMGTGANRQVILRPPPGPEGLLMITATVTPPGGPAVSASFDLHLLAAPDGLMAYESFDYPFQSLVGLNGGQGFGGPWFVGVPVLTGPANRLFADPPPSLPYYTLATAAGRTHMTGGNAGILRPTALPLGEEGTVRYFSLLARPEISMATANIFFGLRLMGGGGVDLFAGKPTNGSSPNYVLEDAGGGRQAPGSAPALRDQPALLVVKLESRPGPDRISLFVDPAVGVEPSTADAVKEDLDLGVLLGPALYANTAWSADELRVGTTFASVTPPTANFELAQPASGSGLEHTLYTQRIVTREPLPAGRTVSFELVGETFGAAIDRVTGIFSWTPGEEAENNPRRFFTVRATNNANPPTTYEVNFYLDVMEENRLPALDAIPNQSVPPGTSLSYQLVATDADLPIQPLSYSIVTGPDGLAVSSGGLLTWTPTLAQAERTFPVTVAVTDSLFGRTERSFDLTSAQRLTFAARWIGTSDGAWTNAANWDIARVPNNTPTETFIVFWDAHPVTIRVPDDIAVRSFIWRVDGTLNLESPTVDFVVEHEFTWNQGTLAGQGRMTVHGRSELQWYADPVRDDALTLLDQSQLILRNFAELGSRLLFNGNSRLVIETTGDLAVAEGGEFRRIGGTPEVHNKRSIRVWSRAWNVPMMVVRNFGTITAFNNTLDFLGVGATDPGLIQESGGLLSLGTGPGAPAHIYGKVLGKAGSFFSGDAEIDEAHIEGTVHGRLNLNRLSFGPTAVINYQIAGPEDKLFGGHPLNLSVGRPVALAGRLEVGLRQGFAPGPDDQYTVIKAAGEITGQFTGAAFGQRIDLADGMGSFLLTLSADTRSVMLSRFWPPPVFPGEDPLVFRLPEIAGDIGGSFIAPHPATKLPDGNWAGGRMEVEITDGFNSARDRLEFRANPAFPSNEITFEGPPDGQTVLFRGAPFGTVRITDGRKMVCLLDITAGEEAIVALLGHLYYANSEVTPEWFTRADIPPYPERRIALTLTDAIGMEDRSILQVEFPVLWGIQLAESILLPTEATALLTLEGSFSNGQTLPVPSLATQWSQNCNPGPGVLDGAVAGFPGQQNIRGAAAPYCCAVTARAGGLQTRIEIYEGRMERVDPSPLLRLFLNWFTAVTTHETVWGNCPAVMALFYQYAAPLCAVDPAPRAALPMNGNNPTIGPSLTTLYALETLMKENADGRRLVDMYRQHGAEVVQIFLLHPSLLQKSLELVTAFHSGVGALLAGKGQEVTITPAMIGLVNAFWSELAQRASPALKATLEQEQARFDGFRRFEGGNFSNWAGLLGLPIPSQPRLHISVTQRDADRFRLVANDIPDADVTLWRSLDLINWELVANAVLQRDGVNLLFTDPTPPAREAFYMIRP